MLNGIVIPCYNEANRLNFMRFKIFLKTNTDFTLCFVNDGSNDETLNQLKKFQKKMGDQVFVHDMPQNGGKSEAVRQGINTLLSKTDVDNIGFLDADLATGFDDYLRLVNELKKENLHLVVGSRKISESIDINRSQFRKLASNAIGRFIQLIIGLQIKDTQCGAKVFSRVIAKNIFQESFHSRWLFDVEIFIKAKKYFGEKTAMNYMKEVCLLYTSPSPRDRG